jgi:hypothetical protein
VDNKREEKERKEATRNRTHYVGIEGLQFKV